MDLYVDDWLQIFDLLPPDTAGAQAHLGLALCFPNARIASLDSAHVSKAKFLRNSLDRLRSGLEKSRDRILVQSLIFVSLAQMYTDEAYNRQELVNKFGTRPLPSPARFLKILKWNRVRRLEWLIGLWISGTWNSVSRRSIKRSTVVHEYLHKLHNMRPVAMLAGHVHRMEVDAKDSKWRKQMYKDVIDNDIDMLLWRYRSLIRKEWLKAIYDRSSLTSPRIQHVWAWWKLYPRRSSEHSITWRLVQTYQRRYEDELNRRHWHDIKNRNTWREGA